MNTEELTATGLVRVSVRELAANWKMYLLWAAFPLVVAVAVQFVTAGWTDPAKVGLKQSVGGLVLGLLGIWSWTPFILRLHRHIVLGANPEAFYPTELFNGRVFRYLGKFYITSIQFFGLFILVYVVPALMLAFGSIGVNLEGGPSFGFIVVFSLVALAALLVAFALMAMRLTLFGPDVAVDGKASLAYLGKRAVKHRALMVETMVLVWVIPMLLLLPKIANQHYKYFPSMVDNPMVSALDMLLSMPFYALWLIAMSIMYREFSKEWPAMDAEEAARASGEMALKEAKPFNPPSGRPGRAAGPAATAGGGNENGPCRP